MLQKASKLRYSSHPSLQFSRVCLILFEALVKTRVPHASERIACEELVHMSLDCVWDSSSVSLREVQIELTFRDSIRNDHT